MSVIYAREFLKQYETLEGHVDYILAVRNREEIQTHGQELTKRIKVLPVNREQFDWLDKQLGRMSLVYHDIGKSTNAFQNRLLGYSKKKSPHSMHSAFYYMGDSTLKLESHQQTPFYYLWVYLIGYIISMHHNNEITSQSLYAFETRIINYIEQKEYDDFIDVEGINLLEPVVVVIQQWQNFDKQQELTLREYDVIQKGHQYLQACDHLAAHVYADEQIATLLTEDDRDKLNNLKAYIQTTMQFTPVDISEEDALRKYAVSLIEARITNTEETNE